MVLREKVNVRLRVYAKKALGRPAGAELQARGHGVLSKTREQPPETGGVLRGEGIYFHAEAATAWGNVANFGFSADLPFLDEEMEARGSTLDHRLRRLDE